MEAETYVTLRIRKPGASAAEVTARLGIEPTDAHEAGDSRPRGVPFREALWSLSTKADGNGALAEHLERLLEQVEHKHVELIALADDGFDKDWFCYVAVRTNGGLELGVELIRRLAQVPIRLGLTFTGCESASARPDLPRSERQS